jgi:YYY domain-containing protein
VDYSKAVRLTPGQVDSYKSLMLPANQLAIQQAGGTWSQLFDWNAIQNKYPGLGLVMWYLLILVLGLAVYPLVRAAFPGLADRGYPLARIVGLLLWAWLAWLAGSLGLTYSRLNIGIALGVVVLLGLWQAWRQRDELKVEFQQRWKYFLMVEGIFLAFFLLDLLIRLGNPDLWHDPNGGERPMEFAFFNAVLKSTTFPPYDPWFSGGYINYYYYGYVIVGTPVKLLGIVPAIAFNLILPTLYACLAVAGFSVMWNLASIGGQAEKPTWKALISQKAFLAGITGSAVMVLIGNLAIVRMFYRSFMCVAAPGSLLGGISIHDCIITPGNQVDKANLFLRFWWIIKGFFITLMGQNPDGTISSAREIYWAATRVFPAASGGPITEFPLASFLWSDLHAHLMALGVTVVAIAWVLSVVLARAKWKSALDTALAFILGGLVIGSLKPINTWDFYTYLILAGVVLVYIIWRYLDADLIPINLPAWIKRLSVALGAAALLAGLSLLFYQPFTQWFGQAYNSFEAWKGNRTNISSYFVHWGVFLFFIVSWMVWETRQWLAGTPVSALHKLRPYRDLILGVLVLILLALVLQQVWVMLPTQTPPWKGVTILWLVLPLMVWAGVLILRPGLADVKRLVLFMVGTALVITMVVELVVVKGDIGRQNTVFKFYMQAWVLLGLSAAAAFTWLLSEFRKWLPGWRVTWNIAATIFVACSVFFLFDYGIAKFNDRMSLAAPHTLDSMTYMAYAHLYEYGVNLDLSEDYRAIRWMQDNVQGSPVIVEAAAAGVQYQWHSRFSIYTGLPDVVGWQWHEQQQRVLASETVVARGREVDDFYATGNVASALAFLQKYNVRYIIVGQLERAKYTPGNSGGAVPAGLADGLLKFEANNNAYWHTVYRDGQTVIYEVNP